MLSLIRGFGWVLGLEMSLKMDENSHKLMMNLYYISKNSLKMGQNSHQNEPKTAPNRPIGHPEGAPDVPHICEKVVFFEGKLALRAPFLPPIYAILRDFWREIVP